MPPVLGFGIGEKGQHLGIQDLRIEFIVCPLAFHTETN